MISQVFSICLVRLLVNIVNQLKNEVIIIVIYKSNINNSFIQYLKLKQIYFGF